VRPHDIYHRIAGELPEVIGTDHRIIVTTPDIVDASLKFDDVVHECSLLGGPIHTAHYATAREHLIGSLSAA
jgi:hypothetical protein